MFCIFLKLNPFSEIVQIALSVICNPRSRRRSILRHRTIVKSVYTAKPTGAKPRRTVDTVERQPFQVIRQSKSKSVYLFAFCMRRIDKLF